MARAVPLHRCWEKHRKQRDGDTLGGGLKEQQKHFVMGKGKAGTPGTFCLQPLLQEGGPKGRPNGLAMERRGS